MRTALAVCVLLGSFALVMISLVLVVTALVRARRARQSYLRTRGEVLERALRLQNLLAAAEERREQALNKARSMSSYFLN